jgi:hypothetical protein
VASPTFLPSTSSKSDRKSRDALTKLRMPDHDMVNAVTNWWGRCQMVGD